MSTQPERLIQSAILQFLRAKGIYAWVNKTQGTWDAKSGIYRSNGTKKGVSDILGILNDGRFLAIEVKTPKGRVSPEQSEFLEAIRIRGGVSFIARSLDDAIREMSK